MNLRLANMAGGVAFGAIAFAVLAYLNGIVPILGMLNLPSLLGHFVIVWLPVLLSFMAYVSIYRDAPQNKGWLYFQASATAVLVPYLAWQVYLVIGFAILGWQM